MSVKSISDVVIVGAGAAGLIAARELSKKNKKVVVLEGRDRIGGRIHTTKKDFSVPVEAGAEFIHGNLSLTQTLLREAGIQTTRMAGKSYRIERGQFGESEMFDEGWDVVIEQMKKLAHDIPMASFLAQYFSDKKYSSLVNSITKFVEGYDAADLGKVSTFALRDEWTHDEEFAQYRIEGGYIKLVDHLKHQCDASKVLFYLSTVVKHIEWKEDAVKVYTHKDEVFEAEKIIITVPIAILANNGITFSPVISEYIDAAKGFGFGGVIKFAFEFKESLWEKRTSSFRHMPSLGFLFSDAQVPTWWTQLPNSIPILTGWLAGPHAERLVKNEDEFLQLASESLAYIFNCSHGEVMRHIKACSVFNWITDPFACGAYAYATLETNASRKILNTPIANTIYFAGEALYEGPEIGTVEAALKSGKRVAELNHQ